MKLIAFIAAFALAICALSKAQTTPNLNLNVPPAGAQNWNVLLNNNFQILDSWSAGVCLKTVCTLTGTLNGVNATFSGSVNSANATLSGSLNGVNAAFSGALNGVNATLTGSLNGASATFSGAMNAGSVTASTPIALSSGGTGSSTAAGALASLNGQPSTGTQVVGYGSNSTIQAAVTAAGTTGSVVIPQSYAGTDTYNNPDNIQITDLRLYRQPNTQMQTEGVFALMDEEAGGNVQQAATCIQAGACTVVFWGDSITEGASSIAFENAWPTTVQKYLAQHYPSVTWTFLNYAIGGQTSQAAMNASFVCNPALGTNQWYRPMQTSVDGFSGFQTVWPSGCITGHSWQQHVHDATPDIVFWAFGANDGGLDSSGEYLYDSEAITYMQGFPKPPTIVIVTNTLITQYNSNYSFLNPALIRLQQEKRDLGKQLGLPVMDVGRLYDLYLFGTDYAQTRFSLSAYFNGYPSLLTPSGASAWQVNTGTPTLTWIGDGTGNQLLTIASPGSLVNWNNTGVDFSMSAQFQAMTIASTLAASSIPTYVYRSQTSAISSNAYELQVGMCNSSCSTSNRRQMTLYWINGLGNPQVIASAVATSTATTLTLAGRVQGAHHQWYLYGGASPSTGINPPFTTTPTAPPLLASIDVYDYNYMAPGLSTIGFQTAGGQIQTYYDFVGNPQTVFAEPPIPEASMIGINDFYIQSGWFNSMGGDAIHHPSAIGHDMWAQAFAPVLKTIDRAVGVAAIQSLAFLRGGTLSTSNIAWQAGVGNTPTGVTVSGTDGSFQVGFTTTGTPLANSGLFTVTFTATRGHTSYCLIQPSFALSATNAALVTPFSASATSMSAASGSSALATATAYTFNVNCP